MQKKSIFMVIMIFVFVLGGCGQSGKDKNAEYGEVIAGLGDDDQYALEDIGEKEDVLFTTDSTYDDGQGHHAALYSNIYYIFDGKACELGRVESMGTAYPISYGKRCIYTASEHTLEIYVIDLSHQQLVLKEQYETVFGDTDQVSYRLVKNGIEETVSEEDYQKVYEQYQQSTVINFGYGASSCKTSKFTG